MILAWSVKVSFKSLWIAKSSSEPVSPSKTLQKPARDSATAVFKITFGPDREREEPGIRNSNLFPVKANGDVRLRSVLSFVKCGSTFGPMDI